MDRLLFHSEWSCVRVEEGFAGERGCRLTVGKAQAVSTTPGSGDEAEGEARPTLPSPGCQALALRFLDCNFSFQSTVSVKTCGSWRSRACLVETSMRSVS